MAAPRAQSVGEIDALWWNLMQELGWDRSHHDLSTHWHVTPDWVTVRPQDASSSSAQSPTASGPPVGLCVPFIYDNSTGWLGFFILQEKYRKQGLGSLLFQATLDVFDRNNVKYAGLDAVPQQREYYKKRGFQEVSQIGVVSKAPTHLKSDDEVLNGLKQRRHENWGEAFGAGTSTPGLRDWEVLDAAEEVDPAEIVALEESIMGFERRKLWSRDGIWKRGKDYVYGIAIRDPVRKQVTALGVIRDSQNGHRIGPIYTNIKIIGDQSNAVGQQDTDSVLELNRSVTKCLIKELLAWKDAISNDTTTAAEVNLANSAAMDSFKEFGFDQLGIYYRMWRHGNALPQQLPGGVFSTSCWAEFDAAEG